jgi:hypothetical protein
MIVCYVDEPAKLFLPLDYSLKFRPENESRRYDLPAWPVVGGSETYPCGVCEIRLTFEDPRFSGSWFYFNKKKAYMFIDPEHDSAPTLASGGE